MSTILVIIAGRFTKFITAILIRKGLYLDKINCEYLYLDFIRLHWEILSNLQEISINPLF